MFARALQYAIKSLSHKRQTESQIREKILRYYPEVDLEAVIERLKELNYVNDREFCEAWIRYRSLTSPRGHYALARELQQKGISSALRQEALAGHEESDVLRQFAEKRWNQLNKDLGPSDDKDSPLARGLLGKKRHKLQRFLLSRGFTISQVIEVVDSVARAPKD